MTANQLLLQASVEAFVANEIADSTATPYDPLISERDICWRKYNGFGDITNFASVVRVCGEADEVEFRPAVPTIE